MAQVRDRNNQDLVVLLAAVPERVSDLVSMLDGPRFDYRHGPAFPTIGEVVSHLCRGGESVGALLRGVCVEGATEVRLRAALDPVALEPVPPHARALEEFRTGRQATVDVLTALSPDVWDTKLADPDQGELSLAEVCDAIALHEVGHLSQMRNLLALLPAQ
jgi:hypothetical protein